MKIFKPFANIEIKGLQKKWLNYAPATGDNPPAGTVYIWHSVDTSSNLVINYRLPDGIDKTFSAGGKSGVCLSPFAFGLGTNNIIGGLPTRILAYVDYVIGETPVHIVLLDADTDMTKYVAGKQIYIHTNTADENSPHLKTILMADPDKKYIFLDTAIVQNPVNGLIGMDTAALLVSSPYDPATYRLNCRSSLDMTQFRAGDQIIVFAIHLPDTFNQYPATIASIDATNHYIYLTGALASSDVTDILFGDSLSVATIADVASEDTSFASGDANIAVGAYSNAKGSLGVAYGMASSVAGISCVAIGTASNAEGMYCVALGDTAHAEGISTLARGNAAHAQGASTKALGYASHAEGQAAEAQGDYSHAQNVSTKAIGAGSHAGGTMSEATAMYSFAHGYRVKAGAKYAAVFGTYYELPTTIDFEGAFAVGNGSIGNLSFGFLFKTKKLVLNPAYPTDPQQYITEQDVSLTINGRIAGAATMGNTLVISSTTSSTVLNHATLSRWKVTPTIATVPILTNWQDGDIGQLIIYNGGSLFSFPVTWIWLSVQPTLKSNGYDVFIIEQIGSDVFIRLSVTKSN